MENYESIAIETPCGHFLQTTLEYEFHLPKDEKALAVENLIVKCGACNDKFSIIWRVEEGKRPHPIAVPIKDRSLNPVLVLPSIL